MTGNDRFDAECDAIGDNSDVMGETCDVISNDARFSFDAALSDDGSDDSGLEPQNVMSPHSATSPEPVDLQDILTSENDLFVTVGSISTYKTQKLNAI